MAGTFLGCYFRFFFRSFVTLASRWKKSLWRKKNFFFSLYNRALFIGKGKVKEESHYLENCTFFFMFWGVLRTKFFFLNEERGGGVHSGIFIDLFRVFGWKVRFVLKFFFLIIVKFLNIWVRMKFLCTSKSKWN